VRRFYFDHNATTPMSPEVLEVHAEMSAEVFGNASSIHHHGQAARRALDQARTNVAALLRCDRKEVVFTSGGTEADNLAIQGIARQRPGSHLITTAIEHPAVLRTCERLQRDGWQVTYLPIDSTGVVNPTDVRRALRHDTVLISVMHANNEIGTVQPLTDIADIARAAGVVFHSDGVQAAGKIPVDMADLGVDLYSLSGHKMHAPKGVGALFVRNSIAVDGMIHGGRHENGIRAGTENVAGIAAFGEAARLARGRVEGEASRIGALRDRLEQGILETVEQTFVNGSGPRVANTTNICFEAIEGEALVIALDLRGFSVSSGSACSSGAVEPSHVLTAIGLSKQQAKSSVRFSLGAQNTAEQVDALIGAVADSVAHLRRLSPAYVTHV
jgi:cysteine desulfurase